VAVGNIPGGQEQHELMVHELLHFKLQVHNHRKPIDRSARDQFEPLLRGWLWKLKTEGDQCKEADWFFRDMWLAKNGSLVYWSTKEERELIFHTSVEIARISVIKLSRGDSFMPWAFKLMLPPNKDVEISPSVFAAKSEVDLEKWMHAFKQFTIFSQSVVDKGVPGRGPQKHSLRAPVHGPAPEPGRHSHGGGSVVTTHPSRGR